jgi:uncharacterized phosphosugar-binding protein
MVPLKYLEAVRGVLAHLETTQLAAVEQAARLVADCLRGGGAVYCAAIGHSNEADFINRAGGLAAVQPFGHTFQVRSPISPARAKRPRPEPVEEDLEAIRLAVRTSNLRAGDVMFVGSVSGRNRFPVELALACRAAGVKVVAFTSLAYTQRVTSAHPSGKRLFEVADVIIDNGAPYGDAAVDVPGYPEKMLPVSGAAMVVIGWLVWGRVMELTAAAGDPASTFISVNRPDGQAWYDRAKADYERKGY